MSLKLQSFRKYQKPLMFGLAVFLIAAFGIPWDDLFGGRARMMAGRPDGVAFEAGGRRVSMEDWTRFAQRWMRYNRRAMENDKDPEATLRKQFILIGEAEKAGITVSDEELARLISKHGDIRQYIIVELLTARKDDFRTKVEVKGDDVKAYYDEHKEDYKLPAEEGKEAEYQKFEDVRDAIESMLADEKAQKLIDDAFATARAIASAAGEEGGKAFDKAATDTGLERDAKMLYDDEDFINQRVSEYKDVKELVKNSFTAPVGEVRGPFDGPNGKFIYRVSAISPGFDADGVYQSKVQGWSTETMSYGVVKDTPYEKLVEETFSLPATMFERTVREQLLVGRYQNMLSKTVALTSDTLEQDYMRRQEKAKIDYVSFDAETFRKSVTVTDDDVQKFYDQYKDKLAPESDGPGYLQPETVSVEYVLATKDKPEQLNPDDVKKFYEENKKNYLKDPAQAGDDNPEYKPFDEVSERVKTDLIEKRFTAKVAGLETVAGAIARQADAGEPPQMPELARRHGLTCKTAADIRIDGRDFYKMGAEFNQDRDDVLNAIFNKDYSTEAELMQPKAAKDDEQAARHKLAISKQMRLKSGDEYIFRVVDRQPQREVPFAELTPDVLAKVRRDKETQKALDRSEQEAATMAAAIRSDAFAAFAKEAGVDPKTVDPKSVEADSPLAKAASALKAGELSGIIEDAGKLHVVLCTGEGDKLSWSVISFDPDQTIAGPELADGEIGDYLERNVETYADIVPLTGNATVRYVAATYEDVKNSLPEDEQADDAKVKAKADELIATALEEAKKKTKDLSEIVKDTPLTQKWASGIQFDSYEDQEVVGKVENLPRIILGIKQNEFSDVLKTDEAVLFVRVQSKNPGKGQELFAKLSDEEKARVKADLQKKNATGSKKEVAQIQLARYAEQAFREAPDRHMIAVDEKVDLAVESERVLSFTEKGAFAPETIEKIMALPEKTVSDPIAEANQVSIFNVRKHQPLEMADAEMIVFGPRNFIEWKSGMDGAQYRDDALKLAREAAQKVAEAAKTADSLKAALASVSKDIKTVLPLYAMPRTITRAAFGVQKKAFDLKPGTVSDVLEEYGNCFLLRLNAIKPCGEAKIKYVRVSPTDFTTDEVKGDDARKQAEEAMAAFREAAVKAGSLEAALDGLKKQMAPGKEVKVGETEDYFSQADAIPNIGQNKALMNAVFAAKPGEFTQVVKDISSIFVAQVEDVKNDSVIVDVVRLAIRPAAGRQAETQGSFSDPNGLPKEKVSEYYEKNKEKYLRDESRKIDYVVARGSGFRQDAENAATDEALQAYFDENKAKYQGGTPDKPEEAKFDDVKDRVKDDFITDKSGKLAEEAIAKVKDDIAKDDANVKVIARKNKLESQTLDFKTQEEVGKDYSITGIPEIKSKLFTLKKGELSDVLAKDDQRFLFKLIDIKEPYVPELKEVETRVRADLDREQMAVRALEAAGTLKADVEKAVADGKSLEDALKDGITFTKHIKPKLQTTDTPFSRRVANPYYGMWEGQPRYNGGATLPSDYSRRERPKLTDTAFALHRGTVSDPIREEGELQSVYVIVLRQLITPDKPDEKTLKNNRYAPERLLQKELVENTIDNIVKSEFIR
ncbi:MAG TPA: peptidyl-prolyl cis-trans isomerase [Planctomycetota bacterium]|nr:peptidyl-prolyl cis-trans isomerase [Planctomycetota bacterium]